MESGIESGFLEGVIHVSLGILSLAVVVAFVRVLRGPSLPDRVVAIDFASYVTMGFLGTYAILSGREAYIDAALVLGLLAFIGTIALARYIEGRSGIEQYAGAYQQGDYSAHRTASEAFGAEPPPRADASAAEAEAARPGSSKEGKESR